MNYRVCMAARKHIESMFVAVENKRCEEIARRNARHTPFNIRSDGQTRDRIQNSIRIFSENALYSIVFVRKIDEFVVKFHVLSVKQITSMLFDNPVQWQIERESWVLDTVYEYRISIICAALYGIWNMKPVIQPSNEWNNNCQHHILILFALAALKFMLRTPATRTAYTHILPIVTLCSPLFPSLLRYWTLEHWCERIGAVNQWHSHTIATSHGFEFSMFFSSSLFSFLPSRYSWKLSCTFLW